MAFSAETSRWKKELSYDFRIEIVSSKPCQTRLCRHFRQISCLGRQANVKHGLVKRSLSDQKKTLPDSRGASTIISRVTEVAFEIWAGLGSRGPRPRLGTLRGSRTRPTLEAPRELHQGSLRMAHHAACTSSSDQRQQFPSNSGMPSHTSHGSGISALGLCIRKALGFTSSPSTRSFRKSAALIRV